MQPTDSLIREAHLQRRVALVPAPHSHIRRILAWSPTRDAARNSKAPCKRTQNCWPTTRCLRCCFHLHTLLYVVACCCPKFETGQTFEPTTPNISFVPWSPKCSAIAFLRSVRRSFLHFHFISAVHIWFISYIISKKIKVNAFDLDYPSISNPTSARFETLQNRAPRL